MKRIFTFIGIVIVGFSAITGCQKYDYSPSMGATVDTFTFGASGKVNVYAQADTSTHNPQLLIITGVSDVYTPGTAFKPKIVLTAPNVVGTYTIDTNNKTRKAWVYTSATGATGTVAVSGQINVLSIDGGKVKGSFTLTCKDGTTLNKGQYVAEVSFY